jgi:3-oxoadipate enol-lactonase
MEMAGLPMSVEAYLAQLNVIQKHDTTDRLDRIQGYPVLVMAGEEDILIPTSLSKKLHESLPKADWATSKGGHASMWENPTDFNRTYLGWLGEHR